MRMLAVLLALAALSASGCNRDCPVEITRGADGRWIVGNTCR